jgi:hypothetical protein
LRFRENWLTSYRASPSVDKILFAAALRIVLFLNFCSFNTEITLALD